MLRHIAGTLKESMYHYVKDPSTRRLVHGYSVLRSGMVKLFDVPYVGAAVVVMVVMLGCAARLWAMTQGHNFDIDSYRIVEEIVNGGGNVYAETERYNYGPVWLNVLHAIGGIARFVGDTDRLFRLEIVGILTAADLVISAVLWRKFGLLAAAVFFLNPISIAITGFHNQFDNVAIAIALVAVLFLQKAERSRGAGYAVVGGVLLGLSLMTKHLYFMLPVWLAWRQTGIYRKLVVLLIPIGLFLIAFVPYWGQGHTGIIQNVFLYKSFDNAPFYNFMLPQVLQVILSPDILFLGGLVGAGYLTRKLPLIRAVLWYLVGLVMFSPAIANQYLAIVMPAVVAFASWAFIPFVALATVLLWVTSSTGVHNVALSSFIPHSVEAITSEPQGPQYEYRWIIAALSFGVVVLLNKNSNSQKDPYVAK